MMKKIVISLLFIWVILCPTMALEKDVDIKINVQSNNGTVDLTHENHTYNFNALGVTNIDWTFTNTYTISDEDCGNFSRTCEFNITNCEFYNATISLLDGAEYDGLCQEDLDELIKYLDSVYLPKDQEILNLKANVSDCSARLENKEIEHRNYESIISNKESEIKALESGLNTMLAMFVIILILVLLLILKMTGNLNKLFRGPRR